VLSLDNFLRIYIKKRHNDFKTVYEVKEPCFFGYLDMRRNQFKRDPERLKYLVNQFALSKVSKVVAEKKFFFVGYCSWICNHSDKTTKKDLSVPYEEEKFEILKRRLLRSQHNRS